MDNFYTMEGSALKGTMVGGALDPTLSVEVPWDTPSIEFESLVADAALASPINGMLVNVLDNRFTLHHNGMALPLGEPEADVQSQPDPADRFEAVEMAAVPAAADLVARVKSPDQVYDRPGGVNSSLQESQSRTLHVRATGQQGEDGPIDIVQNLFSPIGSEFRFRAQGFAPTVETAAVPDALTFLAAGIAFCFMTQFGRYATITKKELSGYRIVQDTWFHPGGDGRPGRVDPVETHVHLVTPEDADFAQRVLRMGEQTCFLHATCRTPLTLQVNISEQTSTAPSAP